MSVSYETDRNCQLAGFSACTDKGDKMPDIPGRWSAYERLQSKLAKYHRVDDYTWGLEAALDHLLVDVEADAEEAERAIQTEGRKERHRARLRRIYSAAEEPAEDPDHALDARRRLRVVNERVNPEEWLLLRALGEGYSYKEIGAAKNVSPGTLRARVLRLRRNLTAIAS